MSKDTAQHSKLAMILAFSLLVHAVLLLWPIEHEPSPGQPATNRISLVAPPVPPTPIASEPVAAEAPSPSDPPPPEETTLTEASETPDPVHDAQPEPAVPATPDAVEIRRQALQLAGENAVDSEGDVESTLSFRAVPRLPGATGWMDQHVGNVAASREHWRSADGGLHSRIVTASGHVVCASIRAPTMQEFFNPWMSSAVTMLRSCGQERPQSIDSSDPWQRRAGD
jgi:hypothetical protein